MRGECLAFEFALAVSADAPLVEDEAEGLIAGWADGGVADEGCVVWGMSDVGVLADGVDCAKANVGAANKAIALTADRMRIMIISNEPADGGLEKHGFTPVEIDLGVRSKVSSGRIGRFCEDRCHSATPAFLLA